MHKYHKILRVNKPFYPGRSSRAMTNPWQELEQRGEWFVCSPFGSLPNSTQRRSSILRYLVGVTILGLAELSCPLGKNLA